MRDIKEIIVHCAATSGDVTAATIRKWHMDQGWSDIGYHHLIRMSGLIEPGRPKAKTGAHVKGHNKHSIGICLAGGIDGTADYVTKAQWEALEMVVRAYVQQFPKAKVCGHNDFTDKKTCPNFDVGAWWKSVK